MSVREPPAAGGATGTAGPLAVLERVRRGGVRPRPGERCDLCGEDIGEEHGHVVDLDSRQLLCACRGCHLLFVSTGAGGGRRRAVPERYQFLRNFALDPAAWDGLQIPVGVAFFLRSSESDEVSAFYPGPAGATESLLPLGAWEELASDNPALGDIEPDVEAALVRVEASKAECYVVPIDVCYELIGHLRTKWRGFDGGNEARAYLEGFFDELRRRSSPVHPRPDGDSS